MGLKYNLYLDGNKIYGCQSCKTHLADHDEILSRVSTPSHLSPLPSFLFAFSIRRTLSEESSKLTTGHTYLCRTSAASMVRPTYSTKSSTSIPRTPTSAT